MSALPPKANIAESDRQVRFVPIADNQRSQAEQFADGIWTGHRPVTVAPFRRNNAPQAVLIG